MRNFWKTEEKLPGCTPEKLHRRICREVSGEFKRIKKTGIFFVGIPQGSFGDFFSEILQKVIKKSLIISRKLLAK